MANVKETAAAVKNAAAKKVEETKVVAKDAVKAAGTAVKETEEKVAKAVETKVATDEKAAKVAEKTKETATKAKETAAKAKDAVKKKAAKTAAKASAKKANGADPEMFIQFGGNDAPMATVIEKIRAAFIEQGHRASTIKDLKVYLKPEDNAAYYVINKNFAGKVDLF